MNYLKIIFLMLLLQGCVSRNKYNASLTSFENEREQAELRFKALKEEKDLAELNFKFEIDTLRYSIEKLRKLNEELYSRSMASSAPSISKFPEFPPTPSRDHDITSGFKNCNNYREAHSMLSKALNASGYSEQRVFEFSNGFALVTQLEHISEDGSPKPEDQRWVSEMNYGMEEFTLTEYFKVLFTAKTGYYRCLVFIASPDIQALPNSPPTEDQVRQWAASGSLYLPDYIGDSSITKDTKFKALIYVFKKTENDGKVTMLVKGEKGFTDHLSKPQILKNLSNGN